MTHIALITHQGIGQALLDTAKTTLTELPCPTQAFDVGYDTNPDDILQEIARSLDALGDEDILILTDIYGATPHNVAEKLTKGHPNRHEISGVNLPMLIRTLNYAHLPLEELCQKALTGGSDGIFDCGKMQGSTT